MTTKSLIYDIFSISIADGWEDITATLDDVEAPLTFANPDSGVGALQLSLAVYTSGTLPGVHAHDLSELLREFAATQGLGNSFDRLSSPGEIAIEAASFHAGDDFARVWYASDGKNVVLLTYICPWVHRDREALEREKSVRSLRFRM
jgi:hypothetical protein